jgi:drug/metabolite transporter (DMT)-like permease
VSLSLVVSVLLAALLHAGWNAIVKAGDDGLITLFLVKLPTVAIAAGILGLTGLPDAAAFPYIVGSTLSFLLYCYLLTAAYRVGDLGFVYPIARGTAPLFIALAAAVTIAEIPDFGVLVGIGVVSIGVLYLISGQQLNSTSIPAALYATGVGISIAGYSVSDGVGVRLSNNPLGYVAALHLVSGIALSIIVCAVRGRRVWHEMRRGWIHGSMGGAMMFAAYAIVVYAMVYAPLAAVTALRETSVVFAALIGAAILKEPFGRLRTVSALIVTVGIVVVTLAGTKGTG